MIAPRSLLLAACTLSAAIPVPAGAAPWWYVGRGVDRVLFIDAGSIRRDGDKVSYASKTVIRKAGDPVAMTSNFMQADCARHRLGWGGIQRFGYDETVIDTSTVARPDMKDVPPDSLAEDEIGFVCSGAGDHEGQFFRLTVDDAAFTEALLAAGDASPRAVQDRLAANPATPVIRSSAPGPDTFGRIQTVGVGQPLVPPRDYEKGPQIPDPAAYPSNETGRIYDVAYQGIKDGQLRFEIRGYSIDDLVHPGSGQIETASPEEKIVNILDLAITVRKATPDSITYSVAIEKRAPVDMGCPRGACDEHAVDASSDRPRRHRR